MGGRAKLLDCLVDDAHAEADVQDVLAGTLHGGGVRLHQGRFPSHHDAVAAIVDDRIRRVSGMSTQVLGGRLRVITCTQGPQHKLAANTSV